VLSRLRRKHHASLKDKIEGKIETKVGEKLHNPNMGKLTDTQSRQAVDVDVLDV
jgi:hypothetical protein